MEKQNLFNKISTIYVIRNINSYISSLNFVYKLIAHCKSEQERLSIKLSNYQKLYYYKTIDLSKYSDDKDILNSLRKKISLENEETFKRIAISYFLINTTKYI